MRQETAMEKDVKKLMKQAQRQAGLRDPPRRQALEVRRTRWPGLRAVEYAEITRVDQIAKMREFTGRALDGLFDGEWTVEDVADRGPGCRGRRASP
jgi:hypothetical protein